MTKPLVFVLDEPRAPPVKEEEAEKKRKKRKSKQDKKKDNGPVINMKNFGARLCISALKGANSTLEIAWRCRRLGCWAAVFTLKW